MRSISFEGSQKRIALFIIAITVCAAYSLIVLQVFSLRNDQVNYFLPVRMYMSDAFNHHEFLFWNPYLSGSYPMHCDMQSPVWNPFVIVLAWLFDYNITLLSLELLMYYIIGAIGCFYFALNFSKNIYACIAVAICYSCSGFAAAIPEFMSWAGSFAFVPWVAHFGYLVITRKNFYTSIKLSLSLWLLLVCGYPSFLIYLGYIFLSLFIAYFLKLYMDGRRKEIPVILKQGIIALVFFILLSLPAIHSYFEYLPYYIRGKNTSLEHINSEFFTVVYPLSLIFPTGSFGIFEIRDDDYWHNDTYIGLIAIITLCLSLKKPWPSNFRNRFLAIGCFITFLFTLGKSTPVRMWCARNLPLMDSFGFSHSVRLFLILASFIWIAPALEKLFSGNDPVLYKRMKWVSAAIGIILIIFLYIGLYHASSIPG